MTAGDRSTQLQARYARTGDPADLDAAIEAGREQVDSLGADGPDLSRQLNNLGYALRIRFEATGNDRDLDEAIEVGRRCTASTPAGHSALARRWSNLSYALRLRYERWGETRDIAGAVAAGRTSLAAASATDPDLPLLQSNLAVALRVAYEVSGDVGQLEDAIELGTAGLAATDSGDVTYPGLLNNLGLAHHEAWEVTGAKDDLLSGHRYLRRALAETPDDDPDRPGYALNLSMSLRAIASSGAIAATSDAVLVALHVRERLPEGHPLLADSLSELGRAYRLRAMLQPEPGDARRAVDCRRAAAAIATAAPTTRALAAQAWAEWSVEDGEPADALAGYQLAVELLPRVAWHGLERTGRERQLGRWAGLAEHAAAAAVRVGQQDLALQLLELGRTVLWNELLDRDLAALYGLNPTQAERLQELQLALDTGPGTRAEG